MTWHRMYSRFMNMCGAVVLVSSSLLANTVAIGQQVYRWIDSEGRVHYGNVIPDSARNKAKPVDLSGTRITEAQREEALSRLEKEKSSFKKPTLIPEPGTSAQAPTPRTSPAPTAADFPSGKRACEEALQRYRESVACFAPYVNVGGSVKAEAFKVCKEVPLPHPC